MSKKQKTPSQLKRQYNVLSKTCFYSQFFAVAAPYLVIGGIKFNDYFIEYSGWKMSLASVIAFVVMGGAIVAVSTKKIKSSYGTLLITWLAFIGFLFLIDKVVEDLKFIMSAGVAGLLVAWELDAQSNRLKKKVIKIDEGIALAEKESIRDAYQEEVANKQEKKKVKIRVRKE